MTLENSEPSLKQCSNCQLWFEKATFPPQRARCTECHRKMAAFSVWKSKLKHEYGITPEIHQAIYEDQAGKCFFCGEHRPSRGPGGLVVDHDHEKETGFVRGLLCQPCNANFIDEYKNLPREYQDSPRTNAYLLRGETGDYIESIRQRLASSASRGGNGHPFVVSSSNHAGEYALSFGRLRAGSTPRQIASLRSQRRMGVRRFD